MTQEDTPIPPSETDMRKFTTWMAPILACLRELGGEAPSREVVNWIAEKQQLPKEFLAEKSPGRRDTKFRNAVHYARSFLVLEGFLDNSTHGVWRLTPEGAKTFLTREESRKLKEKWDRIKREKPEATQDTTGTRQPENHDTAEPQETPDSPPDPEEEEEIALLTVLQNLSPEGFERVCQCLLRAHGFENVVVTRRSHDEGIDGTGVLQLNAFVSYKVLFQCKRYKDGHAVGSPDVRNFKGSIDGRAGNKGIILTTGTFTSEARAEAERAGATPPVELVDGEKLVAMFESKGLGVKPKTGFDVDLKFFEQFREGP